ncbi:unnamed protein product, partial [Hydatigera taeniaeformis]|uniref:PPR_long domain-containing protein n=1 Tax=Hydatigena taeniaeformis TaxID=6205 RepID=A0A0R3XBE0_HYDTA
MFFLRHRSVLAFVLRVAHSKTLHFSGRQPCPLLPTPVLANVSYSAYPTPGNREERSLLTENDAKNASFQMQLAERNRLNIRLMDTEQQRVYFNELWDKIAAVFIRRSCERGNMEETSFYLKAMHQEGAVPNDYIFSKILHGYVKCGLPDEVATTQDVMSKLNYWPSMMATEDLLSAYADLGDGNGVIELLQETLNRSESLLNRPVFSPRFLADLYARLAVAPQFDTNEQAASTILGLLRKRPPYFDDFRLGIALTRLLKAGHNDAAFQFLRGTHPHTFTPYFLSKISELLVEQDPKTLADFWLSSGAFSRLPEVIRTMPN